MRFISLLLATSILTTVNALDYKWGAEKHGLQCGIYVSPDYHIGDTIEGQLLFVNKGSNDLYVLKPFRRGYWSLEVKGPEGGWYHYKGAKIKKKKIMESDLVLIKAGEQWELPFTTAFHIPQEQRPKGEFNWFSVIAGEYSVRLHIQTAVNSVSSIRISSGLSSFKVSHKNNTYKNRGCNFHSEGASPLSSQDANISTIIKSKVVNNNSRVWQRFAPKITIQLNDGYIQGYNRGEWGGGLLFKPYESDSLLLLIEDNIKSIYPVKDGFIVIAGLAHMSRDRGAIYCIHRDMNGIFITCKLHDLPSSPKESQVLTNDEIQLILRNKEYYILKSNGDLVKTEAQNMKG